MKFLIIVLLLVSFKGQGQSDLKTFPEDYLGVYAGTLSISSPDDDPKEIPMEFQLTKTDTADKYNYILIYDGQPREYNLIKRDDSGVMFAIDENNGIVLDAVFLNNTLHSLFTVEDNFLHSRMEFGNDTIQFEIISSDAREFIETGKNMDLEIFSCPIGVVQRSTLTLVRP